MAKSKSKSSASASANQVLQIRVVNTSSVFDAMSELEAQFLSASLALYRNVAKPGRMQMRANVSHVRIQKKADFWKAVFDDEIDVLHIVGHGFVDLNTAEGMLEVGITGKRSKRELSVAEFAAQPKSLRMPPIVVSTACKTMRSDWCDAFRARGVKRFIASRGSPTIANVTAWDMSFYSALLSQVWKGKTLPTRIDKAFALADTHYRAVHANQSDYKVFHKAKL